MVYVRQAAADMVLPKIRSAPPVVLLSRLTCNLRKFTIYPT